MATLKTVQSIKLLIQSTLNGHTPKGLWVAQAIAGEELYAVGMQLQMKLLTSDGALRFPPKVVISNNNLNNKNI